MFWSRILHLDPPVHWSLCLWCKSCLSDISVGNTSTTQLPQNPDNILIPHDNRIISPSSPVISTFFTLYLCYIYHFLKQDLGMPKNIYFQHGGCFVSLSSFLCNYSQSNFSYMGKMAKTHFLTSVNIKQQNHESVFIYSFYEWHRHTFQGEKIISIEQLWLENSTFVQCH